MPRSSPSKAPAIDYRSTGRGSRHFGQACASQLLPHETDLRYITRVKSGWQLRLRQDGANKAYDGTFSDSVLGGRAKSLRAAKRARARLIREGHGYPSRRARSVDGYVNEYTSAPGVFPAVHQFQAVIQYDKQPYRRSFSVFTYGVRDARARAEETLERWQKRVRRGLAPYDRTTRARRSE